MFNIKVTYAEHCAWRGVYIGQRVGQWRDRMLFAVVFDPNTGNQGVYGRRMRPIWYGPNVLVRIGPRFSSVLRLPYLPWRWVGALGYARPVTALYRWQVKLLHRLDGRIRRAAR